MIRLWVGEIPLRNPVHADESSVHPFLRHVILSFDLQFHPFCFGHFHPCHRIQYELTALTAVVQVLRQLLPLHPRPEYLILSHPSYPIYPFTNTRTLDAQVLSPVMLAFHINPWVVIDIYLPPILH
jgi:hypothetical protein